MLHDLIFALIYLAAVGLAAGAFHLALSRE
jgi:hypothetical protein